MILFSVLALRVVTDTDDYFGAVGDVSGVSVGKEAGWSLLLAELDYSVKKSPWAEHRHGQPWLGLTGVSQNPPVLCSPGWVFLPPLPTAAWERRVTAFFFYSQKAKIKSGFLSS